MRVSNLSLLALPLLAAAAQQESPLEQVKAQAQYWLGKLQSYIPQASEAHTPPAAAAKVGGKTLNILTLETWENTIRSSVKPSSTKPEEWWVLISGGNKTCFGQCEQLETAFNKTALLWSVDPTAPHLAYLNCDAQPVLCNAWGSGPPALWFMNVPAPPGKVDIRTKHMNLTTTTTQTFTDLHKTGDWKKLTPYEGWFHPFDGQLAQYGLAIPLGYVFWFFAVVPSWLFMIGISFLSRTIMSRRAANPGPRPAAGAPPAAAAR